MYFKELNNLTRIEIVLQMTIT